MFTRVFILNSGELLTPYSVLAFKCPIYIDCLKLLGECHRCTHRSDAATMRRLIWVFTVCSGLSQYLGYVWYIMCLSYYRYPDILVSDHNIELVWHHIIQTVYYNAIEWMFSYWPCYRSEGSRIGV